MVMLCCGTCGTVEHHPEQTVVWDGLYCWRGHWIPAAPVKVGSKAAAAFVPAESIFTWTPGGIP